MDSKEKLKKNNYFWITGICLPEPSTISKERLLKVGKFPLSHY